jgi:hypothetical protein
MARTLSVLIAAVAALTWQTPASAQTETYAKAAPRLAATVLNPCTAQYVNVSGTTNLSVSEAVDVNGRLKFVLSAATNLTGTNAASTLLSNPATSYSFTEIETVVGRATAAQPLELGFDSKMQARGSTAGDRWGLAVRIKVTIDEFGTITSASVTPGPTRCIG